MVLTIQWNWNNLFQVNLLLCLLKLFMSVYRYAFVERYSIANQLNMFWADLTTARVNERGKDICVPAMYKLPQSSHQRKCRTHLRSMRWS